MILICFPLICCGETKYGFTEKDKQERTDLYSIMDIVFPDGSKPRSDSNFEKNYINGRYGAIPYIVND